MCPCYTTTIPCNLQHATCNPIRACNRASLHPCAACSPIRVCDPATLQPCASQESLRRYRKLQRKSKAASSAALLGAPTEPEEAASPRGLFGLFSKGGAEEPGGGGRRTSSASVPKAHAGSGGERRERERRPSRHEEGFKDRDAERARRPRAKTVGRPGRLTLNWSLAPTLTLAITLSSVYSAPWS